jgi:hypothetical protein
LEDDEFIPGELLLQSYKKITKKFQIGKKKKKKKKTASALAD